VRCSGKNPMDFSIEAISNKEKTTEPLGCPERPRASKMGP